MMKLMPSQLVYLIEKGTHQFEYRPPQSDKIFPGITVSRAQKKALQRLGVLYRSQDFLINNPRGLQRLGCCGDCEQWLFEHWLNIITQLIGRKPKLRHDEKTNIHGLKQLEDAMLTVGCSRKVTRSCVKHLREFMRKARRAQMNKICHKPYHKAA